MNKLIKSFIGVFILIILIWLVLRFVVGGPEDAWICENGQWVKHGNPSFPAPASGCGDELVITNFEECVAAGFAVMESYPRQCRDGEGNLFIEDIGNELEKIDLIRIDNPRPNQQVSSPLEISGEARGSWFFEADFPVRLEDANGNILAQGIASTSQDWMTEDFVEFKAEFSFDQPTTEIGMLVLEKDNPSGLAENADELRVPVKF